MKKIITALAIMASTFAFSQVGIGTTTPSAKSILDLTATDKGFLLPRMTSVQRTAIAPNNTTDVGMQVYDTTTLSIWYWNGTTWVQQGAKNIYDSNGDVAPIAATNRTVTFTNGGSLNFDANTLFVDATNNRVGIGTTTPIGFLHINRTGNPSNISTSFVDGIVLSANSSGPGGGLAGPGFYFESLNGTVGQRLLKVNYALNASNQAYLNFQAVTDNGGASVRDVMSIFHNGRVGIGNTAPSRSLQIRVGDGGILVGNTSSGNLFDGTANVGGVEVVGEADGGYISAQRNGDAPAVHVTKRTGADGNAFQLFSLNGAPVGRINLSGTTGVSYVTTSDMRLKTNIVSTSKGIDAVLAMNPVDYTYKSDKTNRVETGFLAQELYEILPQAVSVGGEDVTTKPWGVDYSKLTPVLVKAIKEQRTLINRLLERIDKLEEK